MVVALKGGVLELYPCPLLQVHPSVVLVRPVLVGLDLLRLHELGHHHDQLVKAMNINMITT